MVLVKVIREAKIPAKFLPAMAIAIGWSRCAHTGYAPWTGITNRNYSGRRCLWFYDAGKKTIETAESDATEDIAA